MQFDQLKRREFITLLEGAAASSVCWPLAARAQEPGRAYHFGTLHSAPRFAPHHIAFFDEVRRLGFLEGQNLRVDVVDRIRVKRSSATATGPQTGHPPRPLSAEVHKGGIG
jgi:hypothetical protein